MDNSLIDRIREASDIVQVISSYIPLKRAGSNFRGVCPFHKDTHPSLNVSQSKQIFKCFACGKAGNVFTFVQEYERLSFMEAVKVLAGRAAIQIPEFDKTKVVSTKRDQLIQVYAMTRDFYADCLFKHGKGVLDYLAERKLSAETAKQLELGYALNSEKGLLNHLLKQGFGVSLLKESGLFSNVQGNMIDFFRDRLMFPIHDSTGKVLAFGGRTLNDGSPIGKYINSPGTELYTKGNELYGLFKSKYELGKDNSVLVCEGYFDFLRVYESGFKNSVASLGTALTDEQIYLLARYTENIYMLYDGDKAGRKAAVRAALLCISKGLNPQIIELPDKQDPDTFILEFGPEELKKRIASALPAIDYIASSDALEIPVKERIEQILDAVRPIKDPIRRDLLLNSVAEIFSVKQSSLSQKLRLTSRQETPEPVQEKHLEGHPEEKFLLALALKNEHDYYFLAQELSEDYFFNVSYKKVFRFLVAEDRAMSLVQPATLLDTIEDAALRECLADLLFEDLSLMRFEDTLKQVKVRKIQYDMDLLDRMIEKNPQDMELLKQKETLVREYRSMTKKVVNKILH